MEPIKVLFVCMGNICRSPTAHGIFRDLVIKAGLTEAITTESAGTISYHAGQHPDQRASALARSRGVELSSLTARQIMPLDYQQQTYILAMDYDNLRNMSNECPEQYQQKIALLLSHHPDEDLTEVPDPYYGGDRGFENVFQMVELACINLLQKIRTTHSL